MQAYTFIFFPICLYIFLSVCLSSRLAIDSFAYLSIYLSIYVSIYLEEQMHKLEIGCVAAGIQRIAPPAHCGMQMLLLQTGPRNQQRGCVFLFSLLLSSPESSGTHSL